jgi:O-antigen/teichoic acid export membrane protein
MLERSDCLPRTGNLARGTLLSIGGQAWQLVTAFLLYKYLSHEFGLAGFGRWRLALSVLNYFELLVNSGLVKVVTKRIADTPDDSPRLERAAYLAQMTLAGALFAAALVLAGPIAARLDDPSLAFLLRIAALDIPLVAAFMVATAVLLGVHRFERQALGMTIYATAKFLAIGFLVWRGFSLPGALIGNAISSVVGFAVTFELWRSARVPLRETAATARSLGRASLPFFAQSMVEGVTTYADLWFVGAAILNRAAVGLYSSAAALAEMQGFLFAGLHRALFPSIARVHAEKDDKLAGHYTRQAIRLALFAGILGVAIIVATGSQALRFVYMFTDESAYAAAAIPFALLMVAAGGQNVRATISEVLMARDRRALTLGLMSGSVVFEVILLALLTTRYGLAGAASAAAITGVVAAVASLWFVRDLVGWSLALTFVRCSVAAVIVGVVLALASPTPMWLLVAYPVATVAYVGILIALGEIGKSDFASIRAMRGSG